MAVSDYFTPEDLRRVEEAVLAAEARTSGEIVPYVAESSDDYGEAGWRGAAAGAVLLPLVAAVAQLLGGAWGASVLWIALPAVAGAGAGWLLALVPWVRRQLVPSEDLDRRTELAAAAAFVEHEVFATRDRTGILLYLSLFEHRVVVVADTGIHAEVEPGAWDGLVAELVAGIRAGRAGEALVEAIGRCGALLERRGVEPRPDDVDELPNVLRTGEE